MTSDEREREEVLESLVKDHTKEYSNAIAIKAKVNRLRENEDFKWLTAIMQSNLDTRVQVIFSETKGFDSMIVNMCKAAEVRGFQAAMLFAQSLLNGAEQTIKMSQPFVESNEEQEPLDFENEE